MNKFKEKKFDILSIDFTKPNEYILKIKDVLESNDEFKKNISRLIYGGKIQKKEVREMTLKVLCEVYLRNGISESEKIFRNNTFSFKQLCDNNLIHKYDKNGVLIWNLSPYVLGLNKKIIEQFNLSIEDYLVPIYSIPTVKIRKDKKTERTRIDVYKDELISWHGKIDNDVIINLNKSLKLYSIYIDNYKSGSYKVNEIANSNLDKIKECIWTLMKCIIRFESPLILDICGEANIMGWTLRHRSLECSQHFLTMSHMDEINQLEKPDLARIISFGSDAFDELWNEFKESISIYQSSSVKCYDLPTKLLRTIYSEYNKIFCLTLPDDEYFEAVREFVGKTEEIIRLYFLVSSMLIFGPFHTRVKYYPEDIKKYILKDQSPSITSYESYNEYENMNRGQYRQLFTQISKSCEFYRYIVEPVITKWDSTDLQTFFKIFGDININVSHLKFTSLEIDKKDIPTFFRLACRLIANMSSRIVDLVRVNNTIVKTNNSVLVLFGYKYQKNKEVLRIVELDNISEVPGCISRHDITESIKNNDIMEGSDNIFGGVEIELLDIEAVRIKFNLSYCESISILANHFANNNLRALTTYGTKLILLKNQ